MLVGIYNIKDPNNRDLPDQAHYEKILTHNGIPSVRLSVEQPDFWQRIPELSLFIMRFQQIDNSLQLARDILPVVEQDYGIPCFPNQKTAWHYDDKIKQYFRLRAHGFPFTESWVFYDRQSAMNWADSAEYPVVFKLKGGAGSKNVVLIKSPRQARQHIRCMFGPGVRPERFLSFESVRLKHFNLRREAHRLAGDMYRRSKKLDASPYWAKHKNYVLFQKFLPDNSCDTRVTVIGNRAFAFRRLVRKDDFRASGSNSIDFDTSRIDLRCIETAFAVSRKMGFQSMAFDFLENESGDPEFCEVSYNYVSRAVYKCPGYWDPELNWHDGHFSPEYLHLVDALQMPDLRAPELDY